MRDPCREPAKRGANRIVPCRCVQTTEGTQRSGHVPFFSTLISTAPPAAAEALPGFY